MHRGEGRRGAPLTPSKLPAGGELFDEALDKKALKPRGTKTARHEASRSSSTLAVEHRDGSQKVKTPPY